GNGIRRPAPSRISRCRGANGTSAIALSASSPGNDRRERSSRTRGQRMSAEEFDYVVAGGGSAGCALASRLSENPDIRVCLLEAGGTADSWIVRTPIGIAAMLPRKINNWAFETVPQPGLGGRRGYQPRGKGL